MTPRYYLVTTPDVCLTFIGTAESDSTFTWLCTPGGERILRAPQAWVQETTLKETARRIVEDRKAASAGRN